MIGVLSTPILLPSDRTGRCAERACHRIVPACDASWSGLVSNALMA